MYGNLEQMDQVEKLLTELRQLQERFPEKPVLNKRASVVVAGSSTPTRHMPGGGLWQSLGNHLSKIEMLTN